MRLVELLDFLDEEDGVDRLQELFRKKKLNESSGDTMVTGWTNPQTGQEYTMHDVSHYEILQKYWKEMGIPEGLVPTLKDAYTGPGQLKAYENGFIRWFMTDYDEPEIGISAPEPLMKQARPLLARLKKAMPPNAVHLDIINPALTYPEPTKSASFRGHDSVAMNRWFQKPFKHNMYESFRDETTIPNIDDIFQDPDYFRTAKKKEAKIVHMTPEEYIKRSWKGFVQIYRDQGIKPPTEKELLTSRNMELVDEYAEAMKRGDEFPMLSLDYSGGYFSQEGLHRALAAIKAGIKKVPVAIVTSVNEDILTESEHSTGWVNVKSNRDISKSGRPSEVPAHYVYLQLFWKEMGIDKDVADTADDAYADTAQLQAYHNGWIRYFFTSQYNVLYASAPELLWKSATPILMKLVKKFQPENVILDVIDPTSASGKATGMGGTFHGTDRVNMMRWTQDPFRHSVAESRLNEGRVFRIHNGTPLLKDPSPDEVVGVAFRTIKNLRRSGGSGFTEEHVRGLLDPTNNTFWIWNGYGAVHDSVARELAYEVGEPEAKDYVKWVSGATGKRAKEKSSHRYFIPFSGIVNSVKKTVTIMTNERKAYGHPKVKKATKGLKIV